MKQSFAVVDREIGEHTFTPDEYAIVRRVIYSTADFEFKHLIHFSPGAIAGAIAAIRQGCAIVTDVGMVKQGIIGLLSQTFNNPLISAVEFVQEPLPGRTRTETGMIQCFEQYPNALFAIGNAPTALIALCELFQQTDHRPALVIGAPVGFISVVESKELLAQTDVPQIRLDGRKGGSAATVAIVNALITLAYDLEHLSDLPSQ